MKSVFVTSSEQHSERWLQAFPDLSVVPTVKAYLSRAHHRGDICWLDTSCFPLSEAIELIKQLVAENIRVIALSYMPSEQEAYRMLAEGARGYCHAEAVPEQLQEVAAAIIVGGYWMPPDLVQRLVSTALRVGPESAQPAPEGFDKLTAREYEVALEVGYGANNKEIAEKLAVSERTVKAHLTSIFEKLALRDRVQLALAVNRLPIH